MPQRPDRGRAIAVGSHQTGGGAWCPFGIGFTALVMDMASFGIIGPILAAAWQAVPDVAVALNASHLLQWKR